MENEGIIITEEYTEKIEKSIDEAFEEENEANKEEE